VLPDVPARLTTEEAAKLCRVKPGTIRQWVYRGHLDYARGTDGEPLTNAEGFRLFDQMDVARAEHKTRGHAKRDLSLLMRVGAHAA
jgi:excisionase family DNA binding protein